MSDKYVSSEERHAWDRFAASALTVIINRDGLDELSVERAGEIADLMMEERAGRFGTAHDRSVGRDTRLKADLERLEQNRLAAGSVTTTDPMAAPETENDRDGGKPDAEPGRGC